MLPPSRRDSSKSSLRNHDDSAPVHGSYGHEVGTHKHSGHACTRGRRANLGLLGDICGYSRHCVAAPSSLPAEKARRQLENCAPVPMWICDFYVPGVGKYVHVRGDGMSGAKTQSARPTLSAPRSDAKRQGQRNTPDTSACQPANISTGPGGSGCRVAPPPTSSYLLPGSRVAPSRPTLGEQEKSPGAVL